jgi:hypothetical protein
MDAGGLTLWSGVAEEEALSGTQRNAADRWVRLHASHLALARGTGISNPLRSSRQSVSFRISPWFLEKPGFSASVGRMPDGAVGRDAQVQQHRAEEPVVSLSGDISVPQCRRCGSRRWGRRRQARLRRSRSSNIDKA